MQKIILTCRNSPQSTDHSPQLGIYLRMNLSIGNDEQNSCIAMFLKELEGIYRNLRTMVHDSQPCLKFGDWKFHDSDYSPRTGSDSLLFLTLDCGLWTVDCIQSNKTIIFTAPLSGKAPLLLLFRQTGIFICSGS